MQYPYVQSPGPRYPGHTYGIGSIVDARYRQTIPAYSGIPLIECIQRPLTEEALYKPVYLHAPGFSCDFAELDPADQLLYLAELDQVCFPLGDIVSLETLVYSLACKGYHKRRISTADTPLSDHIQKISGRHMIPASTASLQIVGDPAEGTDDGIAIIGPSGTGKSTMLKQCLSHIPQVYTHRDIVTASRPLAVFHQILYIYVVCEPNSDFYGLYASIGGAIDTALHTKDNQYRNLFIYAKSVSLCNQILESLINEFGIGLIVLDEIQNLCFGSTRSETYRRLLKIQNVTKVGIIVLGTEDSYRKMFADLMMKRRYRRISSMVTCLDKRTFATCVKMLFTSYRCFREQVDFSSPEGVEIIKSFYRHTGGLIALVKILYRELAEAYIRDHSHPVLSAAYVESIACTAMAAFEIDIKTLNDPMYDDMIRESLRQKAQKQKKETSIPDTVTNSAESIRSEVLHTISLFGEYSDKDINDAFDRTVADMSESFPTSHDSIVPLVFNELRKRKVKKKKGTVNQARSEKEIDDMLDNHVDLREGYGPETDQTP